MRSAFTVRSLAALIVLSGLLTGGCVSTRAQNRRAGGPPMGRRFQPNRGPAGDQARPGAIHRRESPDERGPRGEHLAEWMNQHSNLSPQQQQQALDREPGFHDLPQATQQRMHERLGELNAMPPQERQRLLANTEIMERLNPNQRAQVRGAMQQLGSLPADQRDAVARTYRQLRDLPPDQRSAALNSDRLRGQFNDAQRNTLNNLMRVEPMLEPPQATAAPR